MDRIAAVERQFQKLEENNAKRHAETMKALEEILDNWNEHKRNIFPHSCYIIVVVYL